MQTIWCHEEKSSKRRGKRITFWFRTALHDDKSLCITRNKGRFLLLWIVPIIFVLVLWEVAFFGFLFPITLRAWHEARVDLWLVVFMAGMMGGMPFLMILLFCQETAMAAISSVLFLFDEQATEIEYFGIFKKRIPALPSRIEILSTPSKAYCYTGRAFLRFEKHRVKIPLLCTKRWFDLASDAERFAANAAEEMRHALKLDVIPNVTRVKGIPLT